RHTRLQGDWSSDVCSSDLRGEGEDMDVRLHRLEPLLVRHAEPLLLVDDDQAEPLELDALGQNRMRSDHNIDGACFQSLFGSFCRSEERRVGKECRCLWVGW